MARQGVKKVVSLEIVGLENIEKRREKQKIRASGLQNQASNIEHPY